MSIYCKRNIFFLLFFICISVFSLNADEIIERIDANNISDSIRYEATMIIERGNRTFEKSFYGYGIKDGNRFFMEFTNPSDRGVKYLRIEDELWIYLPDADDVLKISGNMLKQGMMGSDLSYDDMLNLDKYRDNYSAELTGEMDYRGFDCYVIEVTAKENVTDITYFKRRLIIDKQKYVVYEMYMFAKSGRILKTIEQGDFKKAGEKYYAGTTIIRDSRQKNTTTKLIIDEMEYDIDIPESIFTRQNLMR